MAGFSFLRRTVRFIRTATPGWFATIHHIQPNPSLQVPFQQFLHLFHHRRIGFQLRRVVRFLSRIYHQWSTTAPVLVFRECRYAIQIVARIGSCKRDPDKIVQMIGNKTAVVGQDNQRDMLQINMGQMRAQLLALCPSRLFILKRRGLNGQNTRQTKPGR